MVHLEFHSYRVSQRRHLRGKTSALKGASSTSCPIRIGLDMQTSFSSGYTVKDFEIGEPVKVLGFLSSRMAFVTGSSGGRLIVEDEFGPSSFNPATSVGKIRFEEAK